MRLSAPERLYRRSGLFRWRLRGSGDGKLRAGLQDPWRGDAALGAELSAGRTQPDRDPESWAAFGWLRDLRADGSNEARARTRDLIASWISQNQSWRLPDWRPDLMGQRLAMLAMNFGWYGDSADEAFHAGWQLR